MTDLKDMDFGLDDLDDDLLMAQMAGMNLGGVKGPAAP